MSIETVVYDWAKAKAQAAVNPSPLFEAEVLASDHEKLAKVKSIMIGPCESRFAPARGGVIKEFDVKLILIFLVKVSNRNDVTTYDAARNLVTEMAAELLRLLTLDSDMGGTVRDVLWGKFTRTIDEVDKHPHGVGNLELFINQTGQQVTRSS